MSRKLVLFLVRSVLVAALYFGAGWVGQLSKPAGDKASPDNLPLIGASAGLAVAVLLLGGWRYAPAVAVGAFVAASALGRRGPATAALLAAGNTLEPLAAWWMLCRLVKINVSLSRVRDVVLFVALGAVAGTMLAPALRVGTLLLMEQPNPEPLRSWVTLWLGRAMGVALIAPVILSWAALRAPRWNLRKVVEGMCLLAASLLISLSVFLEWGHSGRYNWPLSFLVFPPIIWAALRFGQRGSSLVTLAITAVAVWGTAMNLGPFRAAPESQGLLILWGFVLVTAATSLLLASATRERIQAQRTATRRRQRLDLLARIATGVTADMDEGEIIGLALARIRDFFPRFRASYSTLAGARALEVVESLGPAGRPSLRDKRADLSAAGTLAATLERGEALIVADVTADPRTRPVADVLLSWGRRAVLEVPLRHSEALVGVLGFDAPEPRQWTAHEARTLRGVAHLLAVTLRDARLQRRQAEDQRALAQSAARLRAAMESSLDCFFILEAVRDAGGKIADFRFKDMNWRGEKWLGRTKTELMGKAVCVEYPINRTNGNFDRYVKVVETQQPQEQEYELPASMTPSGWYYHQVVPLADGVAISTRDIGARKEAERALRQSEERHRTIAESSPVGLWQITPAGKTLYANRALCAMLDVPSAGAMAGRSVYDFFPPASLATVRKELDKRTRGLRSIYEIKMRTATGRLRDVVVYGSPLFDGQGRIESIIGSFVDITDRKQADKALAESQQMFRSFMSNSPMVAFLKSRDGRYVYGNIALERLLGVPLDRLVGRTDFDIFPAEVAQAMRRNDAAVLASGRTREMVEEIPQHDGTHQWLVFKFPFQDAQGQTLLAGLAVDATQRLRAEEALRLSEQESRQAAESNSRLLAEVNHRVRNNLASLISLLRLLRRRMTSVDDLADALESRFTAMTQIHNMLSGSQWGDLDLRTLVTDLLAAVQPTSPHQTPIHISGPAVPIHPRQSLPLALTLMEMFTNSLKHGAHGAAAGRLDITWESVPGAAGPTLRLRWRETRGKPIAGAGTPSLGTGLIEGFVNFELGGQCTLAYPSTGADHVIEFPLHVEGGDKTER